jgi:hypothetical protein
MPGVIESGGATPVARGVLFYGVCIWVRVAVAVAVLLAATAWYVETMAVVVAVGSLYVGATTARACAANRVWWSRTAHIYIGLCAVLAAVIALILPSNDMTFVVSGIVLLDVVAGVAYSFVTLPFAQDTPF